MAGVSDSEGRLEAVFGGEETVGAHGQGHLDWLGGTGGADKRGD